MLEVIRVVMLALIYDIARVGSILVTMTQQRLPLPMKASRIGVLSC